MGRSHTPDKSIPPAAVFAATECFPGLLDLLPVRDVPLDDQNANVSYHFNYVPIRLKKSCRGERDDDVNL